jgi:drug/metabolite transporter (DMT)-like permease
MGFFNPFLYYIVLFEAYSLIPAQEGVALNYIWPVVLVVFSIVFLKQKISLLSVLAILLSFAGSATIALHGNFLQFNFSNPKGVFLAMVSSVFWASFWILNLRDRREPITKMLINFLFGTLYISIWNVYVSEDFILNIRGIAGAIYIGIFEMGLTFVLWLMALKLSQNTAKVSNLVYISPFISLILVMFFVGEKIMPSTIVGLLLIIAGIILQQNWNKHLNIKR